MTSGQLETGSEYLARRGDLRRWLEDRDAGVVGLAEAARRLEVPAPTLRAAARRGSLEAVRVGRDWMTTTAWLGRWYLGDRRRTKRALGVPRATDDT